MTNYEPRKDTVPRDEILLAGLEVSHGTGLCLDFCLDHLSQTQARWPNTLSKPDMTQRTSR
jgi:hypothetical protein